MMPDLQLDHAAFELWLQIENGDNQADLDRAKRMLPIVLDECISATQRNYILKYYIDQMSMAEIAALYGVNRSTVSRVIRRGLDTAYKYLRFTSPSLIKHIEKREPLKNGRKRSSRSRAKMKGDSV